MGLIDQWCELYGLAHRPDETDAEFRERVRQRYQTLTIDVEGRPIDAA